MYQVFLHVSEREYCDSSEHVDWPTHRNDATPGLPCTTAGLRHGLYHLCHHGNHRCGMEPKVAVVYIPNALDNM